MLAVDNKSNFSNNNIKIIIVVATVVIIIIIETIIPILVVYNDSIYFTNSELQFL